MKFEEALGLLREKGGSIQTPCDPETTYKLGTVSFLWSEKEKIPTLVKIKENGDCDRSKHGLSIPISLILNEDWQHTESDLSKVHTTSLSKKEAEDLIAEEFRTFLLGSFIRIYGPFNLYLMPDLETTKDIIIEALKKVGALK